MDNLPNILQSASTDLIGADAPLPSYTGPSDPALAGTLFAKAGRSALPLIIAAIKQSQTRMESVSAVIDGLKDVFDEAGSTQLAEVLLDKGADHFLASDKFKDAVRGIVNEVLQSEASSTLAGPRSKRRKVGGDDTEEKAKDKEVTERVHYIFHELLHKDYSRRKSRIVSDLDEWPHPEETGKTTIDVNGSQVEVWRPDWKNPRSSSAVNFLSEVESRVQLALPTKSAAVIKDAANQYFDNAKRKYLEQKNQPNFEKGKKQAETRDKNQRNVGTHASMWEGFGASPLARCRERDILVDIFNRNSWILEILLRDHDHGLEIGDAAGDLDEWQLVKEMNHGGLDVSPEVWLANDQGWWSPAFREAFWALHESIRIKPSGRQPVTKIIHHYYTPAGELSPSDLPRIRPRDTIGNPMPPDHGKTMWLCPWMINPTILDNPDFKISFTDQLYPDPAASAQALTSPTLHSLLVSDPTLIVLHQTVNKHLRIFPSLDDINTSELWDLRSSDVAEYVARLQTLLVSDE